MSLRATTWALYDAPDDIDAKALRILLIIADNVDDDGTGFALSTPNLAELARMSLRTVKYKLQYLKERGIIRLGDQRTVNYIPANKRPKVYDLCMHTTPHEHAANLVDDTTYVRVSEHDSASRGANFARQESEVVEDQQTSSTKTFEQVFEHEPETEADNNTSTKSEESPSDVQQTCNGRATGVQQTCNRGASMFAPKTINPINPINPLESVRARERKKSSPSKSRTNVRTADVECQQSPEVSLDVWEPNETSTALAVELGVSQSAEVAKFRDHVRAGGRLPADLDAAYRNWLRRGVTLGIAAKASGGSDAVPASDECETGGHAGDCKHVARMMATSTILKNLIKQGIDPCVVGDGLALELNRGSDNVTAITLLASSLAR